MLKHFDLEIGEESISWQRNEEAIAREARLDGLYVVRAGRVSQEEMDSAGLVRSYKQLANVEKSFMSPSWSQASSIHCRQAAHSSRCPRIEADALGPAVSIRYAASSSSAGQTVSASEDMVATIVG